MKAIEVRDVRHSYGAVEAVRGVSFAVEQGEVFGLLGHNGAGKSTIVEILEGHRRPTSGTVSVLGYSPHRHDRAFRDRIGVVMQSTTIDRFLSVRETLHTYAAPYRRRREVDEVLELVGLRDKADARVRSLSGGQQRRLDLGVGIVGHPEVLFLDEPTTGFDPVARRQSWELIRRLCDGGTTVLLTTHYLDEAEHLADRVGVLSQGALVAEGTPTDLIGSWPTTISFRVPPPIDVSAIPVPPDAVVQGDAVTVTTEHPTSVLAHITSAATSAGVELLDLRVQRPSLEDVFIGMGHNDTDTSPASAGAK